MLRKRLLSNSVPTMRVFVLLLGMAFGTIAALGNTTHAWAEAPGDRADTLAREFMSPF